MKWMNCTCCHATVQLNNTSMCLACQRGFRGIPQEDSFEYMERKLKIKELERKKQDLEDAIKERKEPESNLEQHQRTDGYRKTSEASSSHSPKRSKKKKKTKKEKIND